MAYTDHEHKYHSPKLHLSSLPLMQYTILLRCFCIVHVSKGFNICKQLFIS